MLVEVAGLPGATKSKTSDLTAMRHFEFRDEFSGLAARRFVAITTCGDECRQRNAFRLGPTVHLDCSGFDGTEARTPPAEINGVRCTAANSSIGMRFENWQQSIKGDLTRRHTAKGLMNG